MTVLTVIATDPDNGHNGSVTYFLKQCPMKAGRPLFAIDRHMGLITTTQTNALDRESQSEYTILVQAKDRGSPPMMCMYRTDLQKKYFTRTLQLPCLPGFTVLLV